MGAGDRALGIFSAVRGEVMATQGRVTGGLSGEAQEPRDKRRKEQVGAPIL